MPSLIPKIKIGADPEFFLQDKSTGKVVSAHTMIPGTKLEPFKVKCGAIQVDGTAAEFNIDPAENSSQFYNNIQQVLSQFQQYYKGNVTPLFNPYTVYDKEYFDSLPDNVKELGCNPDWNAWTGEVNPAPDANSLMRTASGHIHIGWTEDIDPFDPMHFEDCRLVIKELDYYVGLFSLLWDPDPTRRQLYGKAGAFRAKPYGAEYRTLSNTYLKSPSVTRWVWDSTYYCMNNLFSGRDRLSEKYGSFARDVIDNNQLDWQSTKEGKEIYRHMSMILNFPNYHECLTKEQNAARLKTQEKIVSPNPKHVYKKKAFQGVSPEQLAIIINNSQTIVNSEFFGSSPMNTFLNNSTNPPQIITDEVVDNADEIEF